MEWISVTRTSAVMRSLRTLRFMSWNSRGIKTNIEKVKSGLETENCDVVFLQETHSCDIKVLEMLGDYKLFYHTPTSGKTEVAILIKTNILQKIVEKMYDTGGSYIVVKCTLKGQLFTLVSVYSSETKPLIKLRSELKKHAEGILLIGGDFNVPLNPYLDRTSGTKNKIHLLLRPVMEELLTDFHLVDVWRRLHPKDSQFSYEQIKKKKKIKSRLDYIFVPEESMQYTKNCEISTANYGSDHNPVVFEIGISHEDQKKQKCGLGFQKLRKTMEPFLWSQDERFSHKNWSNLDLPVIPDTSLMISVGEVEQAIQSLVVNNVERPDGIPLNFFRQNLNVLIQHLCTFYYNILTQPKYIPENFNEANKVYATHYIFNVDYLILATIMARWLYDQLQAHSTDYTVGGDKKTVLFTYKREHIRVRWSNLFPMTIKEHKKHLTEPPLLDKFKTAALYKMLKSSPSGERKFLHWGCPLTPVLMTLYLKHVANEMIEDVKDPKASIYISRENVIARFSREVDLHFLENIKYRHTDVDCTILELSVQPAVPDEVLPVEELNSMSL